MTTVSVRIVRYVTVVCIPFFFIAANHFSPFSSIWIAIAEIFHCYAFLLLFELLYVNNGWKGLSIKSQILQVCMVVFRLFGIVFEEDFTNTTWALKAIYLFLALMVVVAMFLGWKTYEATKDTASLVLLFVVTLILTIINFFVEDFSGFVQFMWLYSHFIQAVALLPQFIFCFRDPHNKSVILFVYIILAGAYRFFYVIDWIITFKNDGFYYMAGPLGLIIYIPFLIDFCVFKYKGSSWFSRWVLKIDSKVKDMTDPLLPNLGSQNYSRLSISDVYDLPDNVNPDVVPSNGIPRPFETETVYPSKSSGLMQTIGHTENGDSYP